MSGYQYNPTPGNPAVSASSPLYYDGSSPAGDFTAPAASRKILCRIAGGQGRVTITHPNAKASWQGHCTYTGSDTLDPRANRFPTVRFYDGRIEVDSNTSSASVADGPILVTVEVTA